MRKHLNSWQSIKGWIEEVVTNLLFIILLTLIILVL